MEGERGGQKRARFRRRLIEAGARRDHNIAARAFLDFSEQGQPFGRDLGGGQNIFDGSEFGFR